MSTLSFTSKLHALSDVELQQYGFAERAWAQFDYRVELARRLAGIFDADHLFVVDDVGMVTGESERAMNFAAMQGCDRSLLPGLWLSTGFQCGTTILVYAPPNPIELRELMKIRRIIESKLGRSILIRIFYDGLNDILALFERSPEDYTKLCLKFASSTSKDRPVYTSEYHVEQLKKYANDIIATVQSQRRSLVFPFEVTPYHVKELINNTRLILPDLPTNDKAKHNFILRHHGFTQLPQLLMACVDGSVLDSYEAYQKTMSTLSNISTENTSANVERFSQAIIAAVDRLYHEHNLRTFVKLDAVGAGGWSCMSPDHHPILYASDSCQGITQQERIAYVYDYIKANVIDSHLPTHAVVEEFIEAEDRPGNIPADYTVCGLLLNGHFFPTSINLCGTDSGGQYIEQWTAPHAELLDDHDDDWQQMFRTYADMSQSEANSFKYFNGIYAGDLFIDKHDKKHKQRDWNIRRGGRSSPESLIMIYDNQANYECKITIFLDTIIKHFRLTQEQLFIIYTRVCDELASGHYKMYPFSTGYAYFGQSNNNNNTEDFLKFNFIIDPRLLINEQEQRLLQKCEHRECITNIVKQTTYRHVLLLSSEEEVEKKRTK